MDLTRDTLPDDPEKLKAMIAEVLSARTAFEAQLATLQAANPDMRSSQTAIEARIAALHAANIDRQARIDRLQLLLKISSARPTVEALRSWMRANMLLPLKRCKLLLAR